MTEVAAAIIAGGVAVAPGQSVRIRALLGVGSEAASLPFSRSQESEADHIGLVYMARAEPPEFASDHPSDKHRVERIKEWLPEAERAYEAAR